MRRLVLFRGAVLWVDFASWRQQMLLLNSAALTGAQRGQLRSVMQAQGRSGQ
ncbi:hypothetical protein RchiOBHm_Chr7g0236601 [Rosa chinensis]|uniref:Uncharacterized protein n=1 Tax=Rosa chinensis TaxID=74649 RepID=A0A2P6PH01_ROSCH|nr:hypothetical protein RchiOBHm_Chr7g0236601 [Rosa chinensis]